MKARCWQFLLFIAAPVAAGDVLNVEYFQISGSTARELRTEINRLGPIGESSKQRGDAYTRWHIAWQYELTPRGNTCMAGNFQVDLTATMILPKWIAPPGAPGPLLRQWREYSAALRMHEDGHYELSVAAAEEVRRQLQANNRGQDCDSLRTQINEIANSVLNEYRQKQADYDRTTDFGRKQGTKVL